jgi:hypothetical protein
VAESASEQGNGPSQSTAGTGGETAPETVIYEHFVGFDQLFDAVGAGCVQDSRFYSCPPSPQKVIES